MKNDNPRSWEKRMRSRTRVLGVLLFAAFLSACGEEYLQSTINPVTDYGEVSQNLYVQVFWWTMIILVVVWALLAYILIRFRERPGQSDPKPIHGHMGLEIAWTIAPALIVVAIVIPTIQGVFQVQRPPEGDALIVEVTGRRYWWSFHYPELGITTANELHLPVDRPVSLRLESGDVIHSFWVPRLGGKRDVNPVVRVPEGQEAKRNWMHFTIKEEGVYWGQCAEFCGEAHSLMGIRVVAEAEADFQAVGDGLVDPGSHRRPTPGNGYRRCGGSHSVRCHGCSLGQNRARAGPAGDAGKCGRSSHHGRAGSLFDQVHPVPRCSGRSGYGGAWPEPYSDRAPIHHRRRDAGEYPRKPRAVDHQSGRSEAGGSDAWSPGGGHLRGLHFPADRPDRRAGPGSSGLPVQHEVRRR